jgi:uncharacterized protein
MKPKFVFAALCLLVGAVTVHAASEEDFQAALKSYRAGDVVGSMPLLQKIADDGHSGAQALLAELLDRAEFDEDAVLYYRKSAEQGNPEGMYGLGVMTAAGEGLKEKNPAEGRRWIEKAAALGHPRAIIVLAQAYLRAELDIREDERNTATALRWVQLAAELDYLPALDALSEAYRSGGSLTVSINLKLADEYVAKANRLRGIDPTKGKKRKKKTRVVSDEED